MKNRIYVIKYKMYSGMSGKYALSPEFKIQTLYYGKFERDEFIKKYLYLKEKEKIAIHYGDVVCYTAVLKEIEDMDIIINAI